ncbi:MAG: KDO2-lipid IV(A) lauroyltransferase [Chlamydiales bacterium]|jgi:KDO2-lipid IV(A) lauroyltransferase
MSIKDWLGASLVKIAGYPISLMSYSMIHKLGCALGSAAFYLDSYHRKRTMNNLAIAQDLNLDEDEMRNVAIKSFQSFSITFLEYFRLSKSKDKLEEIVVCENPEIFEEAKMHGKGVIFMSGHQANWECALLDITAHIDGVAVGKPIKNPYLYDWVCSIREMNGSKVINPKKAISSGIRELEKGHFVGMACDQALPESSYNHLFLGVRAWSSSSPALLSYKTGAPLVVITLRRHKGKYYIRYSPLMWPDSTKPLRPEITRMMDHAFQILEASVKETPEQYFWQHNRWKQVGINHVHRKYRHDFILIVLPKGKNKYDEVISHLEVLQEIYPRGFFTFMLPEGASYTLPIKDAKIFRYCHKDEILVRDWRYQMVVDFTNDKAIRRHFKKLGAFHVFTQNDFEKMASSHPNYKNDLNLGELMACALVKA